MQNIQQAIIMDFNKTIILGATIIQLTQVDKQQHISIHIAQKTVFEQTFSLDLSADTSENLINNICQAFQNQDLSLLVQRDAREQPNLEFLSLNPLGQTLLVAYLAAVPEAINQEIIPETGLTPVFILAQSESGIEALRVYPPILEALTHNTLTLRHQGISIENKLVQYLAVNLPNKEKSPFYVLLEDMLQRCRKEKYAKSPDRTTELLLAAFDNIKSQFTPQTPQKKHEKKQSNDLSSALNTEKEDNLTPHPFNEAKRIRRR